MSELLPASNTIIFDEAHQLPETASLFFGRTVSTAQLIELARDTRIEAAAAAKDFQPLPDAAHALDKAARDLRLAFSEDSGRFPFQALERKRDFEPALRAVAQRWTRCSPRSKCRPSAARGCRNLAASAGTC